MITLQTIPKVLVPKDTQAAEKISGKNYDEFQGPGEIIELIKRQPESILSITMPHCNLVNGTPVGAEGSEQAHEYGAGLFERLKQSELTEIREDVLAVYKISRENNPSDTQIGIIGYGKVSEIRTPENPGGTIIRNEGIRQKKVEGRVDIIKKTNSYIGIVNNAVDDDNDLLSNALFAHADKYEPNYMVKDEAGYIHSIHLVEKKEDINTFVSILKQEEYAYVADGNHRSAAAAYLKYDHFLCVFFPIKHINILQYNRLINEKPGPGILDELQEDFDIEELIGIKEYQPDTTHNIGLYFNMRWYKLTPKPELYAGKNAVEQLDAEIIQIRVIKNIFGIEQVSDPRLNFVGGDRETSYLMSRVDSGEFGCAITLPAVTIKEFVAVCRQNLLMPAKSTWFYPKVRIGLVIALL